MTSLCERAIKSAFGAGSYDANCGKHFKFSDYPKDDPLWVWYMRGYQTALAAWWTKEPTNAAAHEQMNDSLAACPVTL